MNAEQSAKKRRAHPIEDRHRSTLPARHDHENIVPLSERLKGAAIGKLSKVRTCHLSKALSVALAVAVACNVCGHDLAHSLVKEEPCHHRPQGQVNDALTSSLASGADALQWEARLRRAEASVWLLRVQVGQTRAHGWRGTTDS